MTLTSEMVEQIAGWKATQDGFGRDDAQTRIRIEAIIDELNSSKTFGCHLLEDDGISNYYLLFSFVVADVLSFELTRNVLGVLIYLSACGPVGVAGRSARCVAPLLSYHHPLKIEDVIDAQHPVDALETATVKVIHRAGYELLTAAVAGAPLLSHIKPYGYPAESGWNEDCVFGALFNWMD